MNAGLFRIALTGCLALLLAACNQVVAPTLPGETLPQSTTPAAAVETQTKPAIIPQSQEPDMANSPVTQLSSAFGVESLIEKAKEDLAQRLSIEISQIDLVEAREVVWPDSSLGCPQPGMKYKQIPYEGALIILQAEGTAYEYHSGGSRGLFLCEKVFKDPFTPPQIDITKLTPSTPDKNNPPPITPDNSIPPGEDQ